MRPLSAEEEAFISSGGSGGSLPISMQGGTIVVTAIVTTGWGGGGGGGGWGGGGDTGGDGGGGGGGGNDDGPPNCPPDPSTSRAENDPAVQAALATARGDVSGVERAIVAWPTITAAANRAGIDPALLAAIGVRETNFRNIDQIGGGLGRGYFQIDLGAHPDVSATQARDITFAANYAADLLAHNMNELVRLYPRFDDRLQATAASYNFGLGNLSGNPATIDVGSTGGNYGSNVVALMTAFKDPTTGTTPGATPSNGGMAGC